ncbi:hypothetical protein ABZ915_07865 [Streptomyces sp. NPDC046915]|uniref:hypothetical protein n=1 Tax=Streptomyces sp. NPDC046915 TaxID=3155257 RepID=UPI0033CC28B0
MSHCIAHIFERLLRPPLPAPGRQRGPDQQSADRCVEASIAWPSRALTSSALQGDEIKLVRPYLVAHERRVQQRRRARRRVVQLAVDGIDIDAQTFNAMGIRAW